MESDSLIEELRQQRRGRAGFSDGGDVDRLPPHSLEAEAGVLGCVFLSPVSCMEECVKKLKPGAAVFYDLRHQEIFNVMLEFFAEQKASGIETITVMQRLKDRNRLDEIGGVAYLTSLPDTVPSAANLSYYLAIVLEKYAFRQVIATCAGVVGRVYRWEGEANQLLDEVARDLSVVMDANRNILGDQMAPQFLKMPDHFADAAFAHLFREPTAGEPGLELPIGFPFKIRRKETTLVSADDGAGKSTLLSHFALHLANQESGVCIASFEEPADVSLWRLAAQLLGKKRLIDTLENRKEAVAALAWLNQRFMFYDFLGISDWRDVLETFRYAAEKHGCWLFVLDSVMRIGIADDDYATQGFASAAFAKFAMDYNVHLFFVVHENKSDSKGKAKVRGSKLWTANANNVCQVERNMDKAEKLSKVDWKIAAEQQSEEPNLDELEKMRKERLGLNKSWDTHFALRKQRYPGSQQNGSKRIWFNPENFQFRNNYEDIAQNFLTLWRTKSDESAMPSSEDIKRKAA